MDIVSEITNKNIFHTLLMDTEVPKNYVSTQIDEPEKSMFNASTLTDFKVTFESFTSPLGWSVTMLEDCFKLRKIVEENGRVLYGISINSSYRAEYYVNEKIVNNEISQKTFPEQITCCNELETVIQKLTHTKLCGGNPDEKYVNIFKARSEPLGFQGVNGELHSNRCTLIMDEKYKNRKRCFYCLKQRESLRCTLKRKKKTSITPFKNLSRDDLVVRLREKGSSISKLKSKIQRQQKRIIHKKGQELDEEADKFFMNILEKALANESDGNSDIGSSRNKTNEDFRKLFMKTQLEMLQVKHSNRRRWHPYVLQWCLFMYEKSPSLYDVLEQSGILQLPSRTTLRQHASNIGSEPGFHADVFKKMKDEAEKIKALEHQEYFSLVLDEIKIEEDLVYRVDTGDIIGYTQLSDVDEKIAALKFEKYREKELASHVLQFMLRGVTSGFKYPFAYFPTHCLTAEKLDGLLWEAIEKLELCGFKVISVVGDGATTNRKCFQMNAGHEGDYKCKNPYSGEEDRCIYFIFDSPHLIKTVRNCLANSKEDNPYRLLKINGEHLTWRKIREIYNKGLYSKGNLVKLHRLTSEHVNLQNRMKVKYATQVLSQSVANALKIEFGYTCPELIRFIEIFNKWFDLMNVGHVTKGYYSRNPNIRPFRSTNDCRLKWLKDVFLVYLDEWEQYAYTAQPGKLSEQNKMLLSRETLFGLRQTTKCILELVPFLLSKGAKFILTDHFNQDPLEQYFCKHRQACMAGSKPTLNKFAQSTPRLRRLAEGNISVKTRGTGGNCQ